MAKQLKTDPITQADIQEYLEKSSDFAFELRVLKLLKAVGFNCSHGGTYEDPVTNRHRQFDIRAEWHNSKFSIHLAIECKNLRLHFPLLISCVPRRDEESYHTVVVSSRSPLVAGYAPAFDEHSKVVPLSGNQSIYKPGEYVGKESDQVGRQTSSKELISKDADVYEKWAQALSSAADLIIESHSLAEQRGYDIQISWVMPALVVPDDTLWVAEFDLETFSATPPRRTDRCPMYVGREYESGSRFTGEPCRVSHLEVMTISGLKDMLNTYVNNEGAMEDVFPGTADR